MPIEINAESLITFADLARALPSRRQQRPVHPTTIHRWRSRGIGGIRLEAVRVGGAWMTTREAFARFCAQLTTGSGSGDAVTSAGRAGAHKDAIEQLEQCGW